MKFSWPIVVASAIAIGLGGGIGLWSKGHADQSSEVVFISVGQGDCTLVSSEGHAMLIDVGPKTPDTDAGSSIIVPDLKKWAITRLDWILLSHPDRDHVGGLGAVHRAFPNAKVIMSAVFENDSKMDKELYEAGVNKQDVDWVTSMDGHLGAFGVAVRCPPYDPATDDNLGCMLVHLQDGSASLTTSGDAPKSVEIAMIPIFNWKAQILHLGHHGSKHSTSEAWLKAVDPQIAIASCGLHNEYGHPHQETVKKVKAAGIELRRTDLDGNLFYRDIGHRFERSQGY